MREPVAFRGNRRQVFPGNGFISFDAKTLASLRFRIGPANLGSVNAASLCAFNSCEEGYRERHRDLICRLI